MPYKVVGVEGADQCAPQPTAILHELRGISKGSQNRSELWGQHIRGTAKEFNPKCQPMEPPFSRPETDVGSASYLLQTEVPRHEVHGFKNHTANSSNGILNGR